MNKIISDNKKGTIAAQKLSHWISKSEQNDFKKVPLNQFRRAKRTVILKDLGIPGSHNNKAIKDLLQSLDEKLGKTDINKPTGGSDERTKNYIKTLENRVNELEQKLAMQNSELRVYKRHDGLIQHLLATGGFIRNV